VDFPEGADLDALDGPANRVYRANEPASLLRVTVCRAGTLARLGHDHVVASSNFGIGKR
jgi:hypothetical protein